MLVKAWFLMSGSIQRAGRKKDKKVTSGFLDVNKPQMVL